jgi:CHAT domain-containing protein
VDDLGERVERLRFQIDTPRFNAALLDSHAALLATRVALQAQALYRLIWQPLAPLLEGIERVVLVPHRELHYVPWCALHDGSGWLIERHELSVAPSAAAWLGARARRPLGSVLAVEGDPATLPLVGAEIDAIGRAFGGRAVALRGSEATPEGVQAHAASADVLHLACHGHFRADNPAFSALELAGGPLTLADVRGLRLAASLVVLSACETGVSKVAPGDELIGMVRGFMIAGASAVLATQWAVSDQSTADLMAALYRELARGQRVGAALRTAQREAAARGKHPFHWAAMTLHGRG